MKEILEIITEVFDSLAVSVIIGFFIALTIVFLIIGDSFLVAIKDSIILTIMLAMVLFLGGYIKYLERKE